MSLEINLQLGPRLKQCETRANKKAELVLLSVTVLSVIADSPQGVQQEVRRSSNADVRGTVLTSQLI